MNDDEKAMWRKRIKEHPSHKNQPSGTLDRWAAMIWLQIHGFPDDYKNHIDFTMMRRYGMGPAGIRPNNGMWYYYPIDLKRWMRNLPKAVKENLEARRRWQREYKQRRKERLANNPEVVVTLQP